MMQTSLKSNIDSQLIRKSKKLFKEQIIAFNWDAWREWNTHRKFM